MAQRIILIEIFRDRNTIDKVIFTQKNDQTDLTIHIAVLQAITELYKKIQMQFPQKISILQPALR